MLLNKNGKNKYSNIFNYPTNDYDKLKREALECNRCRLRENCTQVVMGEGNVNTNLVLVGEGPGKNEDRQGRPFIGRAGKLLDKILNSVNIDREEVYITNVIKCRAPNNRKPEDTEAKTCFPILYAELQYIKPRIIVTLGSTATSFLVDEDTKITQDRGKWVQKGKYYFLPTFHPAYLLRNKNAKKDVWRDFKVIKKAVTKLRKE